MKTVEQHISKLLQHHNCVIVPDMGGFILHYQSAQIHPTSYIFNAPSKSIAFNVNLKKSDGLLAQEIALSESISISEAEKIIWDFVVEIKKTLDDKRPYKLNQIGRLVTDIEQNIRFVPDVSFNYLQEAYGLYSFSAAPVIREVSPKIQHIERIKIKPEKEKKRRAVHFLPAAAVILLMLSVFQILFQTNKNGYELSQVFGLENIFSKSENSAIKYAHQEINLNEDYLRRYKKVQYQISDSILVMESQTQQQTTSQFLATPASEYLIIAGVYSKQNQAEFGMKELSEKNINTFLYQRGKQFMVAANVPSGEKPAEYRKQFAQNSGVENAWVLRIQNK